jgi:hypothetical protein
MSGVILDTMLTHLRRQASVGTSNSIFEEKGDGYFVMDIKKDQFVHFTVKEKAEEILKEGKLRLDKVASGRPMAVFAVSVLWGDYVPGTQVPKEGTSVAILFKTHTLPKYGYVEEVVWGGDVALDPGARIITMEEAVRMLERASHIPDSSMVKYLSP